MAAPPLHRRNKAFVLQDCRWNPRRERLSLKVIRVWSIIPILIPITLILSIQSCAFRLDNCLDDTKLWDSNRTLTLLHLMREHESNFKLHASRHRIEVWDSIAEEMRKFGYVDATKLTCAKKWYNIRKKYLELSHLKSGERRCHGYKEVKYLIPVMKRSRESPFTQHPSVSVTSARKVSLKSVEKFTEAVSAQNQELLDKLEFFRAEREVLKQEQEGYLEEITKNLQKRSERLQYLNHESDSSNHISVSPPTTTTRITTTTTCNEIRNLLPTDVEMVELVDGENIITTTSTSGEPIQLTVCLDWNQVNLWYSAIILRDVALVCVTLHCVNGAHYKHVLLFIRAQARVKLFDFEYIMSYGFGVYFYFSEAFANSKAPFWHGWRVLFFKILSRLFLSPLRGI